MMKIDNAFGGNTLDIKLKDTGIKTTLEIDPRRWDHHELILNILSAVGFSVETKVGLRTGVIITPLPKHYTFFHSAGGIGVLELWHSHTYLKITSEGDINITGKEEIMEKVANLCLHSNPPLTCSVQNGV